MENKKRALFIDRDGTLIIEPPVDFQVDSLQKLEFIPGVLRNMHFIASTLDFELVMVTNQDGLGTPATSDFLPPHEKMLQTFKGEGVEFDDIIIDRTFENEHKPTRKPGTALLGKYMDGCYDLENSFVIGDRITDIQLAKNLGAKGILLQNLNHSVDECRRRQAND
jgi:imidazoleglycerol-phosphate dehydratase/histidinol-phosphatase